MIDDAAAGGLAQARKGRTNLSTLGRGQVGKHVTMDGQNGWCCVLYGVSERTRASLGDAR